MTDAFGDLRGAELGTKTGNEFRDIWWNEQKDKSRAAILDLQNDKILKCN